MVNANAIRTVTTNRVSKAINATVVERARRGRKPLSDAEKTSDMRFMRIAGVRAEKVVKLCKGLEACSNPTMYEYTDTQVALLLKVLRKAVDRVESAFSNPSSEDAPRKSSLGIFG